MEDDYPVEIDRATVRDIIHQLHLVSTAEAIKLKTKLTEMLKATYQQEEDDMFGGEYEN